MVLDHEAHDGGRARAAITALTRADEGRTLDLARGAALRVQLPEDPASGYRWILVELDSAVLAVTSFRHVAAGGGTRIIDLTVIGAGTTPLVLVLRRSWESSEAQAHFAIVVRVD